MKHYVVLRLKPDIDLHAFAEKAGELLQDFKGAGIGVNEIKVYKNLVDRPDNFDVMIEFDMDGKKTLFTFLEHPLHTRFVSFAGPKVETKISFDCE